MKNWAAASSVCTFISISRPVGCWGGQCLLFVLMATEMWHIMSLNN